MGGSALDDVERWPEGHDNRSPPIIVPFDALSPRRGSYDQVSITQAQPEMSVLSFQPVIRDEVDAAEERDLQAAIRLSSLPGSVNEDTAEQVTPAHTRGGGQSRHEERDAGHPGHEMDVDAVRPPESPVQPQSGALPSPQPGAAEWSTGLGEWGADCTECVGSVVCPCLTYGWVVQHLGLGGQGLAALEWLCSCMLCAVPRVGIEWNLRRRFREAHNIAGTDGGDLSAVLFCECCALTQMARHAKQHGKPTASASNPRIQATPDQQGVQVPPDEAPHIPPGVAGTR